VVRRSGRQRDVRRRIDAGHHRVALAGGDVRGEQRVQIVDLALQLGDLPKLPPDVVGREEDAGQDEQRDPGQPGRDEVGDLLRGQRLTGDAPPADEQRDRTGDRQCPPDDRSDGGPDPLPEDPAIGQVERRIGARPLPGSRRRLGGLRHALLRRRSNRSANNARQPTNIATMPMASTA
jgi:hypothetical protein